MDRIANIKLIVDLTLTKVQILKLKTKDGVYDWSMIRETDQKLLLNTLKEIDILLDELKK